MPIKEDGKFIGPFEARKFFAVASEEATVADCFCGINENILIGIDTPIQDFVMTADE